jgi:flagellar hook-associated protein 1 FlgK
LIDQLSKIANISTVELEDGSATIFMAGNSLVERVNTVTLGITFHSSPYGVVLDVSYGRSGQTLNFTDGELRGLIDLRDKVIPQYLENLDSLASTLIERVNSQHSAGYGLDGSTTGLDFFSGSDALNIGLATIIEEDVSLIAASTDGSPGNGSNALAISNLAHQLTMNGNSATFGDFYQSLMGNLGILSQEASQNYTNNNLLLSQLENHRQSVSGVSLDEEMTNMINYQHSFEAAARIISTVDEMMNTIINGMGA